MPNNVDELVEQMAADVRVQLRSERAFHKALSCPKENPRGMLGFDGWAIWVKRPNLSRAWMMNFDDFHRDFGLSSRMSREMAEELTVEALQACRKAIFKLEESERNHGARHHRSVGEFIGSNDLMGCHARSLRFYDIRDLKRFEEGVEGAFDLWERYKKEERDDGLHRQPA